MKVTQNDIAKKLGITRTTVARAINNSGPVKADLKELILKTAEDMGYKVNYQAKTLSMQREVVIWVFLASFYNKYFLQEVCEGVELVQKQLKDSKLRVNVHINQAVKVEEQVAEMETIIKREEPDGVIMIPLTDEAIKPIHDLCNQDDIFLVTLDMDTKLIRPTFHIGPDYYAGGRLAAGLLKRMVKGPGKILLLKPRRFFDTLETRRDGFADVIKDTKGLELHEVKMNIESETIYEVALRELKADKNIVGVYSTIKVDGIPEALMELELNEKVQLVANDMSPYVEKHIRDGVIDACVYFRPFMQGYLSVKKLFDGIIMNERDFDNIETYFDVVIYENLDNFTSLDQRERTLVRPI